MLITNQNAIVQGLANIKLESLQLSEEILELLNTGKALADGSINTSDILELLRG